MKYIQMAPPGPPLGRETRAPLYSRVSESCIAGQNLGLLNGRECCVQQSKLPSAAQDQGIA